MTSSFEGGHAPAVDAAAFRRALARFPTGVVVVAARHGEEIRATTVNAFTSVSLDPPLVLVSLRRTSIALRLIVASEALTISILTDDQASTALALAASDRSDGIDRIEGVHWIRSSDGAPLLAAAVAHLQCTLWSLQDGGDHQLVLGRVERLRVLPGSPLVFADGGFASVGEPAAAAPDLPDFWPWI